DTALEAKAAGDASARQLGRYTDRLETSGILPDFREFEGMDRIKWNPRYYTAYPRFAAELFRGMMADAPGRKQPIRRLLRRAQKAAGIATGMLVSDGIDLIRHL
ncbi:MAG: hypothetical protein ACYDFT_06850, partial [Thermoplasmata archaeon]